MDGPIGDDIGRDTASHGLITLAYYDSGARCFYTKPRAVQEPAALKGLKVRVQQSDMWVALMRAFGANATPLPFGEVYSAIQTGVVDGAENNVPTYYTSRHFEVAKFYTKTEHSLSPEILAMCKRSYDKLAKPDQEIIRVAAKESVPHMRKLWVAMEEEALAKVVAGGAQVVEADKAAYAKLTQPVYDQFVKDAKLKALVERIRAA